MAQLPSGNIALGCRINVLCLPAHDEADEIAALMMTHLLEQRNYHAQLLTADALASEMVDAMGRLEVNLALVSALPPGAVLHSRYLCKRLSARFPELRLLIGVWAGNIESQRVNNNWLVSQPRRWRPASTKPCWSRTNLCSHCC